MGKSVSLTGKGRELVLRMYAMGYSPKLIITNGLGVSRYDPKYSRLETEVMRLIRREGRKTQI